MIYPYYDYNWKLDEVSLGQLLFYHLELSIHNTFDFFYSAEEEPKYADCFIDCKDFAVLNITSCVNYYNKLIYEKYCDNIKCLEVLAFNLDDDLIKFDEFKEIESMNPEIVNDQDFYSEWQYAFATLFDTNKGQKLLKQICRYEHLRYNASKWMAIDLVRQYVKFSIERYLAYIKEKDSIINNAPKWNYIIYKNYYLDVDKYVDARKIDITKLIHPDFTKLVKAEILNTKIEEQIICSVKSQRTNLIYSATNSILNYTNNEQELIEFRAMGFGNSIFDFFDEEIGGVPSICFFPYKYFQTNKYNQIHKKVLNSISKYIKYGFATERKWVLETISQLISDFMKNPKEEKGNMPNNTDQNIVNKPNIKQMLNKLNSTNHKILLLIKMNLLENKKPKEIKKEFLPNDEDTLENIRKILSNQYPNHPKFPFGKKPQKAVNELLKKYEIKIPDN